MSMRSDLAKIKGARHAKCHHEMLRDRQVNPVLKERLNKIATKFRDEETNLSVQFTRTWLPDIVRMLNRERDMRRIMKELNPDG